MKTPVGAPPKFADGKTVPLSPAIVANGLIFVSGQLGMGPDGKLAEGGVEAQTRHALENLKAILAKAGASMNDVVKVTGWLTDAANFAAYNQVYAEYFGTAPPARSMVVSGLMLPDALVEIEAVAVRPQAPARG